ncbi:uncharacterized protein LOC123011021 [Tribolium madens]|uniref:uncharacterized protein LOC123011021 n=1 Tax=Tribolium madens TaxID=41895 RepID=UPI001CF75D3B|nr:uncharacterized protein LOC123011021 [Tribolium madens]XP_044264203.1 uncharacterized protein LOC123011021 [Tribolium madens]
MCKMECNSEAENSDDGLQIVESPRPKKRMKKELNEKDKKIIECVEKDLEENLEEKAAKANLTANNVKNIIKEVVTNEHVLALVRQVENLDQNEEIVPVYEPKFTRAKTKQLLSTNAPAIPWNEPPKKVSAVQKLFTEDLQEESSGDEYVPETPTKNTSFDSQLDTSQGTVRDEAEEANIARRTRSKLSLSHTPLEVIEEAFIPPDITTDMYDMDCDDDEWKEFLKTFTRPLDEVTKTAEDEDHDPEYNILADEEIDEVDTEELRADRAVTISRKEFNQLMTELFEFADNYESNELSKTNSEDVTTIPEQQKTNSESDYENEADISIKKSQIPILAQQMRQHIQMLTQNFLLSYEHPEFSDLAGKVKEMLFDLKAETDGKTASIYHVINLEPALKLIDDWEKLFASKNNEVKECKKYVDKVLFESIAARKAGTEYVVTFPPLLLKTVSNSEVFIYPDLLPRIPFRSFHVTNRRKYYFTSGEENLIALFLEQAIPFMKQDPHHLNKRKKINMDHVCFLINKFLMPHVPPQKILIHIRKIKQMDDESNPIKFFYTHKKAPPTVHYVVPVDVNNLCPPCKKSPESLPLLWRQYIYPNYKQEKPIEYNTNENNNQIIVVNPPVQLCPATTKTSASRYLNFSKKIISKRKLQPNGPLPPLLVRKTRRRAPKKRQSSVEVLSGDKTVINKLTMLPDMPSLGGTPIKNTPEPETNSKENSTNSSEKAPVRQNLSFENITSFSIEFQKPDSTRHATSSDTKDNPDDINELMIASSTVKSVTKKEPSGAEKKRAKMRREFIANIVMATPDNPETELQKEESFAESFFDKLHQTLSLDDFKQLINILSHYDENSGQFVDLYKNVQSILFPKYKELSDEFLLFLTEIQAKKVGQLMPYFLMKDMHRFVNKLHTYFKDQPSQLKKVIKCISDLTENSDLTMENIKSTVLPLFKGNAALTDWFLQIFPYERPPKLLTGRPHEVIDWSKELARPPDSEICETVVLPDMDDPYGGSSCICSCHNDENLQFKTRSQHCKNCGLKFIQGKIFINTGKSLRPAIVSFLTNPEKDHTIRLSATQRKRSDSSPTKPGASPNKESHTGEEPRHSHESGEECDGTKKKKQRKRKVNREKPASKTKKDPKPKPVKSSPKRQNKKRSAPKKNPEHKPGSKTGQAKRPAEQEIEYSEPAEFVELKVSSDHSGESATECFESSQDATNTDSDEAVGSTNVSGPQSVSWSREEDKIILQAFRERSDDEENFKHISQVLQNRSVAEIKNRFHKLMSLLQQMASNS